MGIVIGITALYRQNSQEVYVSDRLITAVAENGGNPIILPAITSERWSIEILEHIDGLIVQGNGLAVEKDMVRTATKLTIPILGIGDGHQVVNLALGGTVQLCDSADDEAIQAHKLKLAGYASELLGTEILIESVSDKVIGTLGKGLVSSGKTSNGRCEMLESDNMKEHYILCMQYHPEILRDEVRYKIFSDFIQAAFMNHM